MSYPREVAVGDYVLDVNQIMGFGKGRIGIVIFISSDVIESFPISVVFPGKTKGHPHVFRQFELKQLT